MLSVMLIWPMLLTRNALCCAYQSTKFNSLDYICSTVSRCLEWVQLWCGCCWLEVWCRLHIANYHQPRILISSTSTKYKLIWRQRSREWETRIYSNNYSWQLKISVVTTEKYSVYSCNFVSELYQESQLMTIPRYRGQQQCHIRPVILQINSKHDSQQQ